jgi:hypothetical protein
MVPQGKQTGMKTINLRGSMVEINPYVDDLFRKVIEQRKLNKHDKNLYYWLKIFANAIYGFFVLALPVSAPLFTGSPFIERAGACRGARSWSRDKQRAFRRSIGNGWGRKANRTPIHYYVCNYVVEWTVR